MVLSVIIPSYNHKQFVLATLEAATRIHVPEKEIIVIDDGSSDGSADVIRGYIAGHDLGNTVQLIARENRGLVRTLNEGLSLAQGKYFYLVASDDIPIPEGIASMVDFLEQHPETNFILGNALVMESDDQREFRATYGAAHKRFFELPFEQRHREMFLYYPQPILLQATVFRTAFLRSIGGWREDIISDDFSLFLRAFSELKVVGKDFAYQPEIMACFYRRHGANISTNLERQFKTVEQSLVELCPPKWRNAALFRNLAAHGRDAVRNGKLRAAAHMLASTVAKTGTAGLVRAAASESTAHIKRRMARRKATAENMHEAWVPRPGN